MAVEILGGLFILRNNWRKDQHMSKKQFKAESKRLLDLMINSIYTHKEIFLRELISNASDAIDKRYYKELAEGKTGVSREDFQITIEADKDAGTLTVTDNGIGMNKEELEKNLGTIARSGSHEFKTQMNGAAQAGGEGDDESEISSAVMDRMSDIDIIGQFGVGFYSAFMVSDKVEVLSRPYGEDLAYVWVSTGVDGYTIGEAEKETAGTQVTLTLKKNTEEENYDRYLEEYAIKGLVKKYSDYISYPIKWIGTEADQPSETDAADTETETDAADAKAETDAAGRTKTEETLNSMIPLWKKQKSQISTEDYNNFYKDKFDHMDPAKVIYTNVDGLISYTALLFVPSKAPYNYYTKDYEKGLQLYSSGVLITDKCADLLPDYFSFVKGLVDSQDLSLNISRETLQHDRQLKAIAKTLEKKIRSELLDMLKKDREAYLDFFRNFGLQLKFAAYDKFGIDKDKVKDLLMFYSSEEKGLVTLEEYAGRMKEDQESIYYASGGTIEQIDRLPLTEGLKDKGYEILYLTDDVDEFALQMMYEYNGKTFKSVQSDDVAVEETEEEKASTEKQAEESREMLEAMQKALEGKVTEVKLSKRLKNHPVCLTSKGGLSIEMEKVLSQMPMDEEIQAEKVLEINVDHEIMGALEGAFASGEGKLERYAGLLYEQARLIEGLPAEDPVAFSNSICELMIKQ